MIRILLVCLSFVFWISPALAESFSADMVTSGLGNMRGKLFFENPGLSRTEMMGMVSIVNRPYVYQLFKETSKFVKIDISEHAADNPMVDIGNFKEWMGMNKLQKTGSADLQGYTCEIYEGSIDVGEDGKPVPAKIWYSPKLEYAVKMVNKISGPNGMMEVGNQLENIKEGSQPARLFTVPSGYTQVDTIEEAMGMPNLPGMMGGEGGKMPSKEEMDAMMKQMENMMKDMQNQ